MNEVSNVSKIDWKEVGITGIVTLVTAIVGCTIAVVVAQTLIIPAIDKMKEKSSSKEKDSAKK